MRFIKLCKIAKNIIETKRNLTSTKMANSRYEYVRQFESESKLLQNTWIVVRIDGKAFHVFSTKHNFTKPNDENALNLMNRAAMRVMEEFRDIILSYGQSDEYSFVFRKDTDLYNRRSDKILTYVNSLFTSSYVFYWNKYFENTQLLYPPSFDARIILYPSNENLRDYLSWRQADVHINNLYNTTFWNLVLKQGLTNNEAEKRLCGTFSSDKNEILFSEFNINYNNEPIMYRKGTILLRKKVKNKEKDKYNHVIYPLHEDMIQDKFWTQHSELLNSTQTTPEYDSEDLPSLVIEQLEKINLKGQSAKKKTQEMK